MSVVGSLVCYVFFFKQKTAYEMRISDWSSDVCSSDLPVAVVVAGVQTQPRFFLRALGCQSVADDDHRNVVELVEVRPELTLQQRRRRVDGAERDRKSVV